MKAPNTEVVVTMTPKLRLILTTIADCNCIEQDLRCCDFSVEDYDDPTMVAKRFMAQHERARLHAEKSERTKVPLNKAPLYFSVHHKGKHVLFVRIKMES